MNTTESIYRQTQELAAIIMKQAGFYSDVPIGYNSEGRAKEW